jgi:hypothetical protein
MTAFKDVNALYPMRRGEMAAPPGRLSAPAPGSWLIRMIGLDLVLWSERGQ